MDLHPSPTVFDPPTLTSRNPLASVWIRTVDRTGEFDWRCLRKESLELLPVIVLILFG